MSDMFPLSVQEVKTGSKGEDPRGRLLHFRIIEQSHRDDLAGAQKSPFLIKLWAFLDFSHTGRAHFSRMTSRARGKSGNSNFWQLGEYGGADFRFGR
jgi:hypothetical protein